MGYIEDEVKRLQGIVDKLDGRIQALEQRQFGGSAPKTTEELRMLLIGPPGAGMESIRAKQMDEKEPRG